jgi:hypothetical protein
MVNLLIVLFSVLAILGILFIISYLTYIIPQIKIAFLPEQNLKKRYGENSWAFITGGNSGIGREFALKLGKQVLIFLFEYFGFLGIKYCNSWKR